jgi:large subunit ribosomal protein L30
MKITQVRSTIGQSDRQIVTLRALGLVMIVRFAEHRDSPALRGMLRQVNHLVRIDGKDD